MREEIGSAQNQSEIAIAKRFDKTPNNLLLSSQQSDLDVSGSLDRILTRWMFQLVLVIALSQSLTQSQPNQLALPGYEMNSQSSLPVCLR